MADCYLIAQLEALLVQLFKAQLHEALRTQRRQLPAPRERKGCAAHRGGHLPQRQAGAALADRAQGRAPSTPAGATRAYASGGALLSRAPRRRLQRTCSAETRVSAMSMKHALLPFLTWSFSSTLFGSSSVFPSSALPFGGIRRLVSSFLLSPPAV